MAHLLEVRLPLVLHNIAHHLLEALGGTILLQEKASLVGRGHIASFSNALPNPIRALLALWCTALKSCLVVGVSGLETNLNRKSSPQAILRAPSLQFRKPTCRDTTSTTTNCERIGNDPKGFVTQGRTCTARSGCVKARPPSPPPPSPSPSPAMTFLRGRVRLQAHTRVRGVRYKRGMVESCC